MPELPEVETMRRIVERELVGRTVVGVDLRLPKLMRTSPLPDLNALVGRRVIEARRRAKVLVVDFSEGLSLMAHFKLAGQLAVLHADGSRFVAGHPVPDPAGPYPHKATHVDLCFDQMTILHVSDIRQFGWLRLIPTDDVPSAIEAFNFGPEAVGPNAIDVEDLAQRLSRRSVPIKVALLDQKVLAGLGNIYVDEALHFAKLHPATPANEVTGEALRHLRQGIVWALERGIEQGGAKIVHSKAYPVDGFPQVHGRQSERCSTCGTPIEKTRVGARGTYFCPTCQPRASAQPKGKDEPGLRVGSRTQG